MQIVSPTVSASMAWMNRGFSLLYRPNEPNRCPACGGQHWHVGRMMAECAFCDTALPLEHVSTYSASPRIERSGLVAESLPEELRGIA